MTTSLTFFLFMIIIIGIDISTKIHNGGSYPFYNDLKLSSKLQFLSLRLTLDGFIIE